MMLGVLVLFLAAAIAIGQKLHDGAEVAEALGICEIECAHFVRRELQVRLGMGEHAARVDVIGDNAERVDSRVGQLDDRPVQRANVGGIEPDPAGSA